jgi:hypothetical protein
MGMRADIAGFLQFAKRDLQRCSESFVLAFEPEIADCFRPSRARGVRQPPGVTEDRRNGRYSRTGPLGQ